MKARMTPAIQYHKKHQGKLKITPKTALKTRAEMNLAYTPGVAEPCIEIAKNKALAYDYTLKGRVVAIVSDGSAVLGLGNIGPYGALPVMEGKAALLYRFSGIEAFPIVLSTQNEAEIIETVCAISPTFAAIMLEDISAPRCVSIERTLEQRLDIPVFHDDQHGTAIVVGAALLNAARLLNKPLASMKVVVSGTGAAGSNILRILHRLGVRALYAINIHGVVRQNVRDQSDFVIQELLDEGIISEPNPDIIDLRGLIKNTDAFIGVSAPHILTQDMVASMRKDPIVFALANPVPEIMPDAALAAGAKIIGTGRSDFPNQINNVLVFPGLMKGLIASRARNVTMEMKLQALYALADLIKDDLRTDYILPDIFDNRLAPTISEAIIREAQKEKPSD